MPKYDNNGEQVLNGLDADLLGAIGRINAPLVHLPLKNNLLGALAGTAAFTRASTATYVDRYGVIQSAANDVARFEKEGLLIEGASTNLLTYSEQFDNTAWSKSGVTVTTNAANAADGNVTADKIVESSSSGAHIVYQGFVASNDTYTFSTFIEAAGRDKGRLYLSDLVAGGAYFNFDLVAETVAVDSGATVGSWTGLSAAIERISGDIYRLAITATKGAGTSIRAYYQTRDSSGNTSYTGDGTSGFYVWGAQFEALPFASSYIVTTTASATRAADICQFSEAAANVSPPSIGLTVAYMGSVLGRKAQNDSIVKIATVENSSALVSFSSDSGGTRYSAFSNASDTAWTKNEDPNYVNGTVVGICEIVSAAAHDTYLDGGLLDSTAWSPMNTPATAIVLGNSNGFCHIRDLRIYDVALTQTEIQLLHGAK